MKMRNVNTKFLLITTIGVIGFLSLFAAGLTAAEKQTLTAEKMWEMKRVGNPVVSPDGKLSAFTVTEYDVDESKSSTDIFILNNETGAQQQLTFSGKEGSPAWSPDGKKLVFVSRRHDGPAQLYILNLSGGEAQKITDLPVGIYAPKWFPDGKRLAFAANILPEYEGDWDRLKKLQDEKKKSKVTAKVTENAMYRFWDRWLTDGYYPRLFSIDVNTKTVTDLMPNTSNYFNMMGGVSYDISPDGKIIALSQNVTEPPYENTNSDIFLLSTDGSGEMTNITPDNQASDGNPVFSNDGKYLLFGQQAISHFYADKVVMTVYDMQAKTMKRLSDNIDLSTEQWFWSEDNKTIYFIAEDRAMNSIFSIPASGGSHKEIFRSGTNNGAALAGANSLVFNHHNLSAPGELYKVDLKAGTAEKMTSFNDEIISNTNWGKVEDVYYKGSGNADVQMFIVYPPDYDPSKKYPLVMLIHGGPHGTFGDYFHFRWNAHLFAAPGYIAAMPNFHGSTSFGQDFAISIHGQHSTKPFEDVMKAADYLIDRGLVDENKMAAAGGSYGGYLVSWIAGQTDRFACLINHAGVYNLHLQFASDYSGNRGYQYGGTPWEDYDKLNAHNPAEFSQNFKTPMMVIHGEGDFRVPVAHGFLVYGIYKSMGLEARLVYYPDENHWILTPQNSIFWYNEVHDWLERYLKP
jgi:dipeptidyl aminopeptidase/acylaminoacyl peptidase